MGIDVYLIWDDQTEEERQAQYCGWDITKGPTGYLRESHFHEPHALYDFVKEGFEETEGPETPESRRAWSRVSPTIPASVLRERLPAALAVTGVRYRGDPYCEAAKASFVAFVELAEKHEKRLGKPCRVYVSY